MYAKFLKTPTVFLPLCLGVHGSCSTGERNTEINEKNKMLLRTSLTADFAGFCFCLLPGGCFKETRRLGHNEQSQYRQIFKARFGLAISLLIIAEAKTTEEVFWQSQSFCCNLWLRNFLSSPSCIVQAVSLITNMLISALVPSTCPT